MSKEIGDAGLKLIKKFEGLRLKAYRCASGVLTIGYGHTGGVTEGMEISKSKAEKLLIQDCQKFASYVDDAKYVPVTNQLNDNQRDALISFAFNCGQNNLRTLCSGRDVETIGKKITLYNKSNGKVLQGLVDRRKAEQELYFKKCSSKYYKKYVGSSVSLIDALKAIGADSSYSNRKKIAAKNGAENYSGQSNQNTYLLGLLKQGKLKKV